MREFDEQIEEPGANDFFMSFYKASYDGEIKEVLPYLRKAYYVKNEKVISKKKDKKSKKWVKLYFTRIAISENEIYYIWD